ncbi:uncharacterized protein LOC129758762 [Uranotaenia lowii]|uniref:uncharacterized protein LOC129758762 n=1 Tax=Uranotaenia lowii TaxID=190385 RepID=UPI002478961E|nr:uncharacterized protein LOC129758762 [Uranotaenia lowii]
MRSLSRLTHWSMSSLIALFLTLLATFRSGRSELFTALADMEELLETEAVLIANLDNYIRVQEDKLDQLRRKSAEYQREHSEAAKDVSAYLSNPVNAFLLTKRLTTDWRDLESTMSYDVGAEFLENITNYRDVLKFPSDEDLNGAAVALMRLQDTYNLDTASVARGELNGVQYSTEMSAGDCFELGRQTYLNGDYYHTVLWMREAMDRLSQEVNRTTTKADVLEYLAFSTFKQGNVHTALIMTNELLELVPNHERAVGNKAYYEKELEKEARQKALRGDDGSEDVPVDSSTQIHPNKHGIHDSSERRLYEQLCRGEANRSVSDLSKLTCRYVTNKSWFLKIAPLKLEEANLQPYIVIYHEVMSDAEIEVIKRLAKPRFRRATVQNYKTGELEVANYRISKSAWLKDEEHPYVKAIGQRVEDMTGLTMVTAEELQVVNYGIGGHYEPHFDFARREEKNAFKSLGTGNRIATVLFYMSDVAQGGATVFPSIRTALWPKKGTAAFWFNLHASGHGDYATRHAACPVLAGTKWVSNKWIHERGQEFLRPCDLKPDHPEDTCPSLDFIVAELVDHFTGILRAPFTLPAAIIQRSTSLRCPPMGRVLGSGGQTTSSTSSRGRFRQHPVLGLRRGPVHTLLHVLLHADPILVAHLDAAAAPFVVVGPPLRIAQDLFSFLRMKSFPTPPTRAYKLKMHDWVKYCNQTDTCHSMAIGSLPLNHLTDTRDGLKQERSVVGGQRKELPNCFERAQLIQHQKSEFVSAGASAQAWASICSTTEFELVSEQAAECLISVLLSHFWIPLRLAVIRGGKLQQQQLASELSIFEDRVLAIRHPTGAAELSNVPAHAFQRLIRTRRPVGSGLFSSHVAVSLVRRCALVRMGVWSSFIGLLLFGSLVIWGPVEEVEGHDERPNEYYSSVVHMESLLKTEQQILERLDRYINLSEEKIKFLKRQREKIREEVRGVSDPISGFLLTKRLVRDYPRIDNLLQAGIGVRLIDDDSAVPTNTDYEGLVEGIAQLQEVYKLETGDLAKGIIRGQKKTRALTAEELYLVGLLMSQNKQFVYCIEWEQEALRQWAIESQPSVSKVEILDYLSYCLNENGQYEEAMQRTDEMLKHDPTHENALKKKPVIANWLEYVKVNGPKEISPPPNRGLYGALCRGEHERPASELSKLSCRYENSITPFIRIAPFKLEEASLDPFIVIYHQALSETEINKIVELGTPKLRRSMVGENHDKEVSKARTSQNGWLGDGDHKIVKRVNQRAFDLTGLDPRSHESLQFNNYGIGGHYLPHFDWVRTVEGQVPYKDLGLGNRVATLMFYLRNQHQTLTYLMFHLITDNDKRWKTATAAERKQQLKKMSRYVGSGLSSSHVAIRLVRRRALVRMGAWSCLIGLLLFGSLVLWDPAEEVEGHDERRDEYFSSVVRMESLLQTEQLILERLDRYISLSEEKIKFLKSQRDTIREEMMGVSDPLSGFLLTKRLVRDYPRIDNLLQSGIGVRLIDDDCAMPTNTDYEGLVEGIAQLQEVYKLETGDLAKGIIRGQKKTRELTPEELYLIGLLMSQNQHYVYCIEWEQEALRQWAIEPQPSVSEVDILDYLSYCLIENGQFEEAMQRTDEMLKHDPIHENALKKKHVISNWLEYVKVNGPKEISPSTDRGLYGTLCRGEHERPASELSKLTCRYETTISPFIRIAPFKLEEVSQDPFIVIYHEALSETEINKIIELGSQKLRRAMVGEIHSQKVSKARTSQNGWLEDEDHEIVKRVNQRAFDLTGLDTRSHESLQFNNYGIGGHYLPHFDWEKPVDGQVPFTDLGTGDRVATLMFYLSDVEMGGATVFPPIGVGVFPKKGTAIFWYNLHRNGTGDERTLHGACPVLMGSKWVVNKWIHEKYTDQVRPCGLKPDSI